MGNLRRRFSKVYDQYVEKIYRFIFLKVSSKEIAEDLTSETFLRTWKKFQEGKGNPIRDPQPFLYQVARNLIVDHYRQEEKRKTVSIELTSITDPGENLEEIANKNSDLEMIKKTLPQLSDDYQNAIIWYYLEEMPLREVAKLLNRSEGATRVLLHRALNSLKDKLEVNLN